MDLSKFSFLVLFPTVFIVFQYRVCPNFANFLWKHAIRRVLLWIMFIKMLNTFFIAGLVYNCILNVYSPNWLQFLEVFNYCKIRAWVTSMYYRNWLNMALGTEARAPCLLDEHSSNWASESDECLDSFWS